MQVAEFRARIKSLMTKKKGKKTASALLPETEQIRKEIEVFLRTRRSNKKTIGSARCGVYAFYDYFGEPIYVGQTKERLGTRVRRHLTNQRTDAVAMGVLDPAEVAEIEVWPFNKNASKETLARAEYTVYEKVLKASKLKAVLNEKEVTRKKPIKLPESHRKRIVPEPLYEQRKHPDLRIARRATQITEIARIITERKVSKGLRKTLYLQALRLEYLAKKRLGEITGPTPVEKVGEETGN